MSFIGQNIMIKSIIKTYRHSKSTTHLILFKKAALKLLTLGKLQEEYGIISMGEWLYFHSQFLNEFPKNDIAQSTIKGNSNVFN